MDLVSEHEGPFPNSEDPRSVFMNYERKKEEFREFQSSFSYEFKIVK